MAASQCHCCSFPLTYCLTGERPICGLAAAEMWTSETLADRSSETFCQLNQSFCIIGFVIMSACMHFDIPDLACVSRSHVLIHDV